MPICMKVNRNGIRIKNIRNADEIGVLIAQASSVSRGYVVEQALEDGWLRYDEHTINTVGAFIYL